MTKETKETVSNIVKTVVIIAALVISMATTIVATSYMSGERAGTVEQKMAMTSEHLVSMSTKLNKHEDDIDTIKTEQAYQKGVIETKLTNLEKSVDEIKKIVTRWELK